MPYVRQDARGCGVMETGVELIAAERTRQIEQEGWSLKRDIAIHEDDDLATAAACYALPAKWREWKEHGPSCNGNDLLAKLWPWSFFWWKSTPEDRVRELVKAGALIAAEIDRLQATKDGAE